MQQNWRKILIWLSALLLVLFLYTIVKVYQAESQLMEFFNTELAPGDTTGGFTVESVNISAIRGEVVLHTPVIHTNINEPAWEATSLKLNIGRWNSLKMGVLSSAFVIARLNHVSIDVKNLAVYLEESDKTNLSDVTVEIYGTPLNLIPILGTASFPRTNSRILINIPALERSLFDYFIKNDIIPETYKALFNYEEWSAGGQLSFDPGTGRLALTDLVTENSDYRFEVNSTIFYIRNSSLFTPSNFTAGLKITQKKDSNAPLAESKIQLSDDFGVLFNEFTLSLEGSFPRDTLDLSLSISELFQDLKFDVSGLSVFPSTAALGDLGPVFMIFGVTVDRFDFRNLSINLKRATQTSIEVSSAQLNHQNIELMFSGNIRNSSPLSDAPISGTLKLHNMSEQIQVASGNIEILLGRTFQRDGDAIILPVRGTLGSPSIFD